MVSFVHKMFICLQLMNDTYISMHLPSFMGCLFPIFPRGQEFPVSCGKCPNCLTRRANSWAFRVMLEERSAVSSHWITLTYATEHVPLTRNGYMTLDRRDPQLFFKRLRKYHADHNIRQAKDPAGRLLQPIKFFGCGEYGSRLWRPHYHIAILNADESSFWPSWCDSRSLGEPLGDVYIDPRPLSEAAISYTCFYMNKPRRVPEHVRDDRVKEF